MFRSTLLAGLLLIGGTTLTLMQGVSPVVKPVVSVMTALGGHAPHLPTFSLEPIQSLGSRLMHDAMPARAFAMTGRQAAPDAAFEAQFLVAQKQVEAKDAARKARADRLAAQRGHAPDKPKPQ